MNPVTLFMAAVFAITGRPDTGSQAMIVVVRHAEQTDETERDPPLSEAGRARAAALDSVLADARVTAIIISQYQRSAATAAPVAARHHLTPVVIQAGAPLEAHAAAVAAAAKGHDGVVLVVGHSNTVPRIVQALGGPALPDLCSKEFSQLFTITILADGAHVVRSRFGAPTAAAECPGMVPR